jgi:hypothetical protein
VGGHVNAKTRAETVHGDYATDTYTMNRFNEDYNHLVCDAVLSGKMLMCQRKIHPPLLRTQFDPEDGGSKLLRYVSELLDVHLIIKIQSRLRENNRFMLGAQLKHPYFLNWNVHTHWTDLFEMISINYQNLPRSAEQDFEKIAVL